jgi:hypothetical protein
MGAKMRGADLSLGAGASVVEGQLQPSPPPAQRAAPTEEASSPPPSSSSVAGDDGLWTWLEHTELASPTQRLRPPLPPYKSQGEAAAAADGGGVEVVSGARAAWLLEMERERWRLQRELQQLPPPSPQQQQQQQQQEWRPQLRAVERAAAAAVPPHSPRD